MNLQLLRTINYQDAQDFSEPLDSVRARTGSKVNYLAGIYLRMELSLASAATSDAINQNQFAAFLPQLQLIDQNDLEWFDRRMALAALDEVIMRITRSGPTNPAAIAANSNTTNLFEIQTFTPSNS